MWQWKGSLLNNHKQRNSTTRNYLGNQNNALDSEVKRSGPLPPGAAWRKRSSGPEMTHKESFRNWWGVGDFRIHEGGGGLRLRARLGLVVIVLECCRKRTGKEIRVENCFAIREKQGSWLKNLLAPQPGSCSGKSLKWLWNKSRWNDVEGAFCRL